MEDKMNWLTTFATVVGILAGMIVIYTFLFNEKGQKQEQPIAVSIVNEQKVEQPIAVSVVNEQKVKVIIVENDSINIVNNIENTRDSKHIFDTNNLDFESLTAFFSSNNYALGYSGEIELHPRRNNSYTYNGGNVVLKQNNNVICTFDYKLNPISPRGNPRRVIEDRLDKQLLMFKNDVSKHDFIIDNAIRCLNL